MAFFQITNVVILEPHAGYCAQQCLIVSTYKYFSCIGAFVFIPGKRGSVHQYLREYNTMPVWVAKSYKYVRVQHNCRILHDYTKT